MFAAVHPMRSGNSGGAAAPAVCGNAFPLVGLDGLFSGLEIIFSATDKGMAVAEKPFSATDTTFSIADKPFSVIDKTFSITEKPLSGSDKGLSTTEKGVSSAENRFSVAHNGLSEREKPLSALASRLVSPSFPLFHAPKLPLFPHSCPKSPSPGMASTPTAIR